MYIYICIYIYIHIYIYINKYIHIYIYTYYPLVNEHSYRKIHHVESVNRIYFYGPCSIAMLVYWRVCSTDLRYFFRMSAYFVENHVSIFGKN